MAAIIRSLSHTIQRKSKVIEIDVGKDVKVVQVKHEEILVDFPNRRSSINNNPGGKIDAGEDQQWELSISNLSMGTDQMSENDDEEFAFLGFPDGGRKRSMCMENQRASYVVGDCTVDEATLSRMALPTTIMFPRKRGKESSNLTQIGFPNDDRRAGMDSSTCRSIQIESPLAVADALPLVEDTLILIEETKSEEFERPSNWITDEDDDSDSCTSEEYRQKIVQMVRERNVEQEKPASPEPTQKPTPELTKSRAQSARTPTRPLNRSRSSKSFIHSDLIGERKSEDNPFSAGFDFATKTPVPRKFNRRPSLTTTRYDFEANAGNQYQQQPRRKMNRRASASHAEYTREYADGLKAFGAKQHDIHALLH